MKKRILFGIILLCGIGQGSIILGQESTSNFYSASWGVGSPVNNYVNFPEITQAAQLLEINVGQDLNGSEDWHYSYNLPHQSFGLIYSSLGNPDILGNMFALTYDFDADIVINRRSVIRVGIGYGAAYLDKPYSETENPENIVNGASFSGVAKARAHYERRLSDDFAVFGGLTFIHTSNSHTQLPNVGMNIPFAAVGVKYSSATKEENVLRDQRDLRLTKLSFGVRASYGFNEQGGTLGAVGGPKYPIYLLSFFATKNFRYTRKWTLGLDVWYNSGVRSFISSQDYYDDRHKMRSSAVALMAGHEFLFGNMAFVIHGGVYVYNPFYRKRWKESNERDLHQGLKTWFPGRVGGYYYINSPISSKTDNVFFGVFIKTNLGQADFLETTIGYQF